MESGFTIHIYCTVAFLGIKLLHFKEIALIPVAQIKVGSIECTVLADNQDTVSRKEFAQQKASSVLVETVDVLIKPYRLAPHGSHTLGFELDLVERVS